MDFIEFLKSSCNGSTVKLEVRDNKIYKGQSSDYTGFSLYELYGSELRVDYYGSSTGYTLQGFSSYYQIYRGGSYTGYDLRKNDWGGVTFYGGGTLYSEGDYLKEQEEISVAAKEDVSYPSSDSSSPSDMFSDGFWSWHSWLVALAYVAGFTFSLGGVVLGAISWWLLLVAPGFMVLWAIMLIIHAVRHRKK